MSLHEFLWTLSNSIFSSSVSAENQTGELNSIMLPFEIQYNFPSSFCGLGNSTNILMIMIVALPFFIILSVFLLHERSSDKVRPQFAFQAVIDSD